MQEMRVTVEEYRATGKMLQNRIDQLNERIIRLRRGGLPLGSLVRRRYMLYMELAELQGDVRCMEEYLAATGKLSAVSCHAQTCG